MTDVEARDVLQPDDRDAVVVARTRELRDLRDPLPIEDAARALDRAMDGMVGQAGVVRHEPRVEPADPLGR